MADDISVQLTADMSDFLSAMDSVADKVNDTMDQIGTASEEAGQRLDEGVGAGAEAAKAKVDNLTESSNNLGEMFEDLHSKISMAFEAGGILLAAEALEKVASALEEVASHATQIHNMADMLNISTDAMQVLEGASDRAGVGLSMLSRTLVRLEEDFRKARDGSDASTDKLLNLGFSIEQIKDKTFDSSQQIAVLAARLQDGATHTATMDNITAAFGARAKMVAEALQEYDGSAQGVARALAAINGLTKEQIEEGHKLHGFFSDMGHIISNATLKLWDWVTAAGAALGAAEATLSGADPSTLVDEKTKAMIDPIRAAAEAQREADLQSKRDAVANAEAAVSATKQGTQERLEAEKNYIDAVVDLHTQNSTQYKKALSELAATQREVNDKAIADAARAEKAQEAATKKVYEDKLSIIKKSLSESEKEFDAYNANQIRKEIDTAQETEKVTLTQLDSAKKVLDLQMQQKTITPATYLTAEVVLINERRDAEIAMYQAIAVARGNDKDAAEKAEAQIAEANAKAMLQVTAANVKATQDTAKAWLAVTGPIESSFTSALDGMLKHTENFRTAMKKTFDTLAMDAINGMINKMLTSWLAAEAAKIAASENGAAVLKALNLTNLVTAKTADTTEATAHITSLAAQAAAGAFAATVLIPYVGPAIAPAAAASADAEVMAFLAQATMEKGAIVPKDMTANVHQDEMMLPAHISKGIQETFSGFAQGASSGAGGGGTGGNHYSINAHDSKSFEKYLSKQSNRNAIMKSLNKAISRGNRNLSGMGNRGLV